MQYLITKTDDSALDTTVFASAVSGTRTITMYTTDETKVGAHTVKVAGYQGSYSSQVQSATFQLTVSISCPLDVVTPSSQSTVTYGFLIDTTITFTIAAFTQQFSSCGPLTYTAFEVVSGAD